MMRRLSAEQGVERKSRCVEKVRLVLEGRRALVVSPKTKSLPNNDFTVDVSRFSRATSASSGRIFPRLGWLERDCETSYLALDGASGGPMDDLTGHSIVYRVVMEHAPD